MKFKSGNGKCQMHLWTEAGVLNAIQQIDSACGHCMSAVLIGMLRYVDIYTCHGMSEKYGIKIKYFTRKPICIHLLGILCGITCKYLSM